MAGTIAGTSHLRRDGYAPIRDYAMIGAGRTGALVARDGSIDWLCLPDFDSPSVFGRLLDAEGGGFFSLMPEEPFEVERRYEEDSNVLETTFRTASGAVRVIDAVTLADESWLSPVREVVRKVEGLSGSVRLHWRVEPRFGYAARSSPIVKRSGRPVAIDGALVVAVGAWGAGDLSVANAGVEGRFGIETGGTALLELAVAHREPAVLPGRDDVEHRLEQTRRFWPGWARSRTYDGPWKEEVIRSALALKLLVYSPSGAIVAAPTTSLPEWIGGTRNWDYRFTWIRDAAYTLIAFLRLGCPDEATAFFWWLNHATALTHPELRVLYRLDGRLEADEKELDWLAGYERTRPVRIGNAAMSQLQLDLYGAMFESVWLYALKLGGLGGASARSLRRMADRICELWRMPDSGIWETRSGPRHFVQSKAMCWVALDRACKLADRGLIGGRRATWAAEAEAIRRFVDEHGWDEERSTYVRASGGKELDASLLTLSLFEYDDPAGGRLLGTVDAVRRELAEGPLVWRYRSDDGVDGEEGFFLTCSFWLAGALAKGGRLEEAVSLMEQLLALANDVGLYAEEVGGDGLFLGNFPQALVHLSLVNAAAAISEVMQ